jgi:FKBP12-rapamycin complex-associated protein
MFVNATQQFIHDPLLTWRLHHTASPVEPSFPSERRQSIMGDVHSTSADPMSSLQQPRRHRSSIAPPTNDVEAKEVQNARALQVLSRVKEKLTGRDGRPGEELNVIDQVSRLIQEATNLENLCQHYIGWCSFW